MAEEITIGFCQRLLKKRRTYDSLGKWGARKRFDKWCAKKYRLSPAYVTKLLAVARAKDPEAALNRLRDRGIERSRRYRERLRKVIELGREASRDA